MHRRHLQLSALVGLLFISTTLPSNAQGSVGGSISLPPSTQAPSSGSTGSSNVQMQLVTICPNSSSSSSGSTGSMASSGSSSGGTTYKVTAAGNAPAGVQNLNLQGDTSSIAPNGGFSGSFQFKYGGTNYTCSFTGSVPDGTPNGSCPPISIEEWNPTPPAGANFPLGLIQGTKIAAPAGGAAPQ